MSKVNVVDFGAIVKIVLHAWSSNNKIECEIGILLQLFIVGGFAKENSKRSFGFAQHVNFANFGVYLEKSSASRDTIRLK